MAKRSLITGVNGQDGAYLARLLLNQGHHVVGGVRSKATADLARLDALGVTDDVELVEFDLGDFAGVPTVIERARVEEIYNLAGQSHVGRSFEQPLVTGEINGLGVAAILQAIHAVGGGIRFFQASTSEVFGQANACPQNEHTPFHPRSPYAAAKAYAHWLTANHRESYGMHAACGILFNHESPLRGQGFVTRKITLGLARVRRGELDAIELGNLDARRDWGYADDYVEGMWRILQHAPAGDFVLATGVTHSVRDFVAEAGRPLGFDIEWCGTGAGARGIDRVTGKTIVRVNPEFFRPADVNVLCGDASKAKAQLGWQPRTSFSELVRLMVEADERRVRDGRVMF